MTEDATYKLGEETFIKHRFFDEDGDGLYNPDTVTFRAKDPIGNVSVITPSNPSTGNYEVSFTVSVAGRWVYEWSSTDADVGDTIKSGFFDVEPSVIDDSSTSLVARLVQSLIPATWDALAKQDYYGVALLNERIQIAKYTALPVAMAEADESTYSPLMRDYIATLSAIEIIPAGIEYWMQQKISISSTGTSEVATYPDRQLALLRGILPTLTRKAAALAANPGIVGSANISTGGPAVSGNDNDDLVTADPYQFPEAFGEA